MAVGGLPGQTDGVSEVYLVVSIVGLALTVNALRPLPTFVPGFFASWLTVELAPHNLVIHAAWNAGFIAAGALEQTTGWIALGLSVLSGAGLLWFIVQSQRALHVLEDSLSEGLGPHYERRVHPGRPIHDDLRTPWRQLVNPFRFRHPDVERIRNLSYGPHGRRNRLDVYRPKQAPRDAPVLIQVHGSGWTVSNKDQQGKPIMLHMAARGWICVAINYRLSPRATWPAHIEDVKRSIAWVRANISRHGGDPSFIVITGGSAGAHLSALAALTPNDPDFQPGFEGADTSVQGCVPLYGLYDLTREYGGLSHRQMLLFLQATVFKRRIGRTPEVFAKASPVAHVAEDAPPFFVIHGRRDSLAPVGQARRFVTKLREVSRAPVAYAELPGTQHAFDVFPSIRTAHVVRAVERFLSYVRETRARRPSAPATRT